MPFSFFANTKLATMDRKGLVEGFKEKFASGNYQEAAEVADELIRRGGGGGYYYKAAAMEHLDKPSSIPLYLKAIELCDHDDEPLLNLYRRNLARALFETGNLDESLDVWDAVYEEYSRHHCLSSYFPEMDFFLYLLAVRDKRWALMASGDRDGAMHFYFGVVPRYIEYIHESPADDEVRPHIEKLYKEITNSVDPKDSDYH